MNKDLLFVLTALEAISKTKLYSNPFSNAQDLFEFGEQLHFNAILKMLEVIGEEANKIDEEVLTDYPAIPWRAIKDMRNRIVHDYRGVDIDIVFSVIKDELPNLKQTLEIIFFKLITHVTQNIFLLKFQAAFFQSTVFFRRAL